MKTALALTALLAAVAPGAAPVVAPTPRLAQEAAPRALALHGEQTYQDLFRQIEGVTGQVLLRSVAVERWGAETRVPIHGSRAVPADELWSVFQALLRAGQLALVETHAGPTTMRQVVSLSALDPRQVDGLELVAAQARYLRLEELPAHAADSAIAYRIALPVAGVETTRDQRQLVNELRSLVSPYGILRIAPGPDGGSAIVTGFGTELAQLVRMVDDVRARATAKDTGDRALRDPE